MNRIYKHSKLILSVNKTDRVWQMPFFAALSVAVVLLVAWYFKRLDLGMVAVFGANVFLYVPNTPIYHRMAVTMCCSFGISVAFGLGLLAHSMPFTIPFVCAIVAMGSGILVRYYDVGAPGYFFFVMSCIIGCFIPFGLNDFVLLIGLITLGGIVANLMAFLYSLSVVYFFKNKQPSPIPQRGALGFEVVVVDSLIMGLFVGISVFIGQLLDLQKSYWIAISCTAVMQGISLSAIWIKQAQRILGTFAGMLFGMALFNFNFSPLELIALLTFLMFMGEFVVVRNYALAMIFITPYTTYLIEIGSFDIVKANMLIEMRMFDVFVGSLIGLVGGFCLYKEGSRRIFEQIAKVIFLKRDKKEQG